MNPFELIGKFQSKLPAVRQWIDEVLEGHKHRAVPVINLPFLRLSTVFPLDLLAKANVVVVAGMVPFPPLSKMGLPEFTEMKRIPMAGITYKDTFFLNHFNQTESLHFHELVHVVQWERLGVDDFLLAYGVGLMQFGYQHSPLEKMAYSLQKAFDHGVLPNDILDLVQQGTDGIWRSVAPLISRA